MATMLHTMAAMLHIIATMATMLGTMAAMLHIIATMLRTTMLRTIATMLCKFQLKLCADSFVIAKIICFVDS